VNTDEQPAGTRRRKLLIIGVTVITVLVVGGVAGSVVVRNHNEDAPVDTVRAYVDAIARGDANAANAAVDPRTLGAGVDPTLLTDQVLGSTKSRLTVDDVTLGFDADPKADVVDVDVTYRLEKSYNRVVLRVQRAGSTAGVLDEWRVIDPFLVPVRVEVNELIGTAWLGPAKVAVGGPGIQGFPERRFYVYPGVYELRGAESQYLTAEPKIVAVRNIDQKVTSTAQPVKAALVYKATPKLTAEVSAQLATHLTACVSATPPKGCPVDMYGRSENNDYRLDQQPTVKDIMSYQVDYKADGSTEPSLRFRAVDGRVTYQAGGRDRTRTFWSYGRIAVSPADKLTITFTTDL
jgi:hypothetical protein